VRNYAKSVSILPKDVEICVGDLTQPESLSGVCAGVDTVFHLGGYAHAWTENNSSRNKNASAARFASNHLTINYLGTQHFLKEAVRAKVKRFIYFSSVKAVADCEHCVDEQWAEPPDSPYGIAKREAEKLVLYTGMQTGMHVSILRPALVYGPELKGNLAAMLRAIDKGLFIPLPETHNRRSMVSVADICSAALLAADNPHANGKIYFVTDGVYYSTRQLYVLMCDALGKRLPKWHVPLIIFKLLAQIGNSAGKIIGRRLPFNSETMVKLFGSAEYNSQQIQNDLGYKPSCDLKKMLPEIFAAYKMSVKSVNAAR
jgi:nucleoside-diphosphate-sugar epimerase